jgi:tRNA threonylcarbamoyl adenosine modification protein YjeE
MRPPARTALLADDAATRALGQALALALCEGDVVALCGPLGAGKTTLAQGFAKGLDVPPSVRVRSPTFTLCNEVRGSQLLLHLDLYRLGGEDDAEALGFRERVGHEGVALVEWADRFPALIPADAIWIQLEHHENGRRVTVWEADGGDPSWIDALALPACGGGERWTTTERGGPWEG